MTYQPLTGKALRSYDLATAAANVFEGAVRSGKTVSTLLWWLKYVRTAPPGELGMFGKTERTLKRNMINPLIGMVGQRRCRYRAGAGEVDLLGRTIVTAGAHNEGSVDKIRGITLAGFLGDEITTWPESFYAMASTRVSVPGAKWAGTCNPASRNHWLMKKYLSKARLWLDHHGQLHINNSPDAHDLHRMSFTIDDNPALDPDFVARLRRENTGLFYQRNIEGLWVLAEGQIYKFDDRKHVVEKLPQIVQWIALGVDYGTTNPFHAVIVGLGLDRVLYVAGEYRHDSVATQQTLTDAEYSKALRAWLKAFKPPGSDTANVTPEYIVVDPSALSFRVQLYRDGIAAAQGDNAVVDGIRTVSTLFSAGLLKIHESCEGLIGELAGYSWDPKATERGEDAPLKVDDHGPDALRYALHTTLGVWHDLLAAPVDLTTS